MEKRQKKCMICRKEQKFKLLHRQTKLSSGVRGGTDQLPLGWNYRRNTSPSIQREEITHSYLINLTKSMHTDGEFSHIEKVIMNITSH